MDTFFLSTYWTWFDHLLDALTVHKDRWSCDRKPNRKASCPKSIVCVVWLYVAIPFKCYDFKDDLKEM